MPDPTTIPVQYVREGSARASAVEQGPVNVPSYDILVPVPGTEELDDQLNVSRLLRTPLAIAEDRDGAMTVASILIGPSDVPPDEFDSTEGEYGIMEPLIRTAQEELATVLDVANGLSEDVSVNGFVGVVDVPDRAFGEFANGDDYEALFLAQSNTDTFPLWDEPTIRSVLDTAECAVYVENIGSDGDLIVRELNDRTTQNGEPVAKEISDILLAISTGPHSVLAAETARAIAKASDASVRAVHLFREADDGPTKQQGRKALTLAEYVLSDLQDVDSEMRNVQNPTEELLTLIEQHDLAVIGAPTKRPLLSRLFARSGMEEVLAGSTTSVITVQQPSDALNSVYYRWKRAVERTSGESVPSMEEEEI